MANIKTGKPSIQAKVDVIRRTRGRNYSASLRLEGFSLSSPPAVKSVSVSCKEELIAKYKQLAY